MFKTLKQVAKEVYYKLHEFTPSLYSYSPDKYNIAFIKDSKDPVFDSTTKVDKIIYCFWTGENPLTPNRIKGLEMMKKNCGVEIKLITPGNLGDYILKDYPLHPAYQNLSAVHKSDYLRCYFMHHYGGGYSDIKPHTHSWESAFNKLNKSTDKLIIGYREEKVTDIAYIKSFFTEQESYTINIDMCRHFKYLIGNGSYIVKPNSTFTQTWYREIHRRLDLATNSLREYPGNIWGDNEGYPLQWAALLGEVFHPTSLRYHRHILFDEKLRPILKGYR